MDYQKPEITSQPLGNPQNNGNQYFAYDTDNSSTGVLETVPVKDSPTSLFVHPEVNEGIHCYAIYGINWFSRVSEISVEKCTGNTQFPKRIPLSHLQTCSTVHPGRRPADLYFRQEQDDLEAREAANPGADNYVTRVTFHYHHVHNMAYQKGNQVRFYFKRRPPMEVKGEVISSDTGSAPHLAKITTGSYESIDGNTISPIISTSDTNKIYWEYVCYG